MNPYTGVYRQGGGGAKAPGMTKVKMWPGAGRKYLDELLSSQGGDKPSRPVSEAEEEQMMNRIWAQDYKKIRRP